MKLLFVENRYKTYFFDLVAAELEKLGHNIYWIVQNPKFLPTSGKIKVIKYPSKSFKTDTGVDLDDIFESDRQLNYFKKVDTSYFYYYHKEINSLIETIKPNFVFGESTAFHELLTIKICKEKGYLFLHPSSCRYPSGRFSFYLNDTVMPHHGGNEIIKNQEAEHILNSIVDRSSKPDYMKVVPMSKTKILMDKAKILSGYFTGEKFNTPNPIIKYNIEKQKKKNISIWDEKAVKTINKNSFTILYPMHLQPEANIDVWGRPKRDQFKSIREISKNLAKNQILYVKPNPKSKYELSLELIQYIEERSNVKMLHHKTSMDIIFTEVDLFITVNGTIALECIFANKPVLTLVEVFFNNAKNCLFINNLKLLQTCISTIQNNNFPTLSFKEKVAFLNLLNTTSFKGVISDPYYSANSISEENIKNVLNAFKTIIKTKA